MPLLFFLAKNSYIASKTQIKPVVFLEALKFIAFSSVLHTCIAWGQETDFRAPLLGAEVSSTWPGGEKAKAVTRGAGAF